MTPVALAYGQVNDSFAGFVSGDQSSSGSVKQRVEQVYSPSNAPLRGEWRTGKDSADQND
jgi:hypothetical protein